MQLNIIGYTWEGYKATYTYNVDADVIKHPEIVKSLAGDFQSVLDYQVIKIEHDYQRPNSKSRRVVTTETIVRDWDDPASEDTWAECEACK